VIGGLVAHSVQIALGTPVFLLLGFSIVTLLNALKDCSVLSFAIEWIDIELSFQVKEAVAEVGLQLVSVVVLEFARSMHLAQAPRAGVNVTNLGATAILGNFGPNQLTIAVELTVVEVAAVF
jgi:hypothetical protein